MPDKTQKEMITEMYGMVQRLDERTQNIWKVNEKQEKHLAAINGTGIARGKRITRVEITLASLIGILIGAGILDATHIINLF